MAKALEGEIDKLFQLPPGEFTAARNALAKGAGPQGASIKALTKPPIAAWAVNQLYWRDRNTYDSLVAAAEEMRKTHRAVIEGRKGDLRSAGREHELALDAALKSTMALLEEAGQPATDATKHAVLNTLRALPADEAPGRLTKPLAPGGFEMLAGVTPAPSSGRKVQKRAAAKPAPEDARSVKERERRAAAERALRDAEQRARQAEFEAARAARDAAKADRLVEQMRQEFEAAREAFEAAQKAAETAVRTREKADRQLEQAQAAVDAQRART